MDRDDLFARRTLADMGGCAVVGARRGREDMDGLYRMGDVK